jgi:hypothetical protein
MMASRGEDFWVLASGADHRLSAKKHARNGL